MNITITTIKLETFSLHDDSFPNMITCLLKQIIFLVELNFFSLAY